MGKFSITRTCVFLIAAILLCLPTLAMAGKKGQQGVLVSAARTGTTAGIISGESWTWCYVHINVTAVTATPTLTINFQMKANVADTWLTIGEAGPISPAGAGDYLVLYGLGLSGIVGGEIDAYIRHTRPGKFNRIQIAHDDEDSATYSVETICGQDM